MELKQIDLNNLTVLWQTSGGNLGLRNAIEQELQLRTLDNRNFSREYIFKVCKIGNHAITILFIPTSEAHRTYGDNVTIDMILDEEGLKEMITNYSAKPPINTYGLIKAKALVKDNLTAEQIELLAINGFNTCDILETLELRK